MNLKLKLKLTVLMNPEDLSKGAGSTDDDFTLVDHVSQPNSCISNMTDEPAPSSDHIPADSMTASSVLPGPGKHNKKGKSVTFDVEAAPPAEPRPDLTESELRLFNAAMHPCCRHHSVMRVLFENAWHGATPEDTIPRAEHGSSGPPTEASSGSYVWVPHHDEMGDTIAAAGDWADVPTSRPQDLELGE